MSSELYGRQKGQALVIAALAMVVLVGFLALAIDGGNAYAQRRLMQNAADAGALAGARALALGENAEAAATEYGVNHNGADSAEVTVDGQTVTVVARSSFPTFFAGVIGIPEMTASAEATASFGAVQSTEDLWPMAVFSDTISFGDTCQLWGDQTGPGGFGWLDWDGPPVGNPELADNICNPSNSDQCEAGQFVHSGPGVQNSQDVKDALDQWLGLEKHVTIIVYDYTTGAGANLKYHVAGFAEFVITEYDFSGADKWVKGKFQTMVEAGAVNPGGPDYGVYEVGLTD